MLKNTSSKPKSTIKKEEGLSEVAEVALAEIQQIAEVAGKTIEQSVAPVRKSILKRFPTLFLLAVTFGITATLTGMEQILIQTEVLHKNPWVIFGIGIGILVLTGRLYKKLG